MSSVDSEEQKSSTLDPSQLETERKETARKRQEQIMKQFQAKR